LARRGRRRRRRRSKEYLLRLPSPVGVLWRQQQPRNKEALRAQEQQQEPVSNMMVYIVE
jgi:hypothetical protein